MKEKTLPAKVPDKTIIISTGNSRHSTNWKSAEMTWRNFVEKLKTTTRTRETVTEYSRMPKSEKDQIKDVGGFVGGALKGGRRKAENVANRSLITLDLDEVNDSAAEIWDNITFLNSYSLVMYSTHTHTPDKPRLRLVIPLNRSVYPDEYQAIARRIADDIGINMFDDTTYEPSRLMYWPSTPADGEYIFKEQIGDWANADQILNSYLDWKDVSSWPVSSRADAVIMAQMKKQEDPHTKPGLIGAFCRTYSIHETISEFLSEDYEATKSPDRYTYKHGSTVGGLVIYDDKFAYSHHGTDPTSGKLSNAFDLVRVHLFGDLDDEAKEGTPINRLPSYSRMMDFARDDRQVKIELGRSRLKDAEDEFDYSDDDADWLAEMDVDKKGAYLNTIKNALLILEHDPAVNGKMVYDEFSNRAIVVGDLPWNSDVYERDWNDTDEAGTRKYLEEKYQITAAAKIDDAKKLIFDKNKYHPVRDYLNGLTWDGVERVERLFVDYLGAGDDIYHRAAARVQLAGAVARVMAPGVKLDTMATLIGPQGIGKSTFLYKLSKGWFSDSLNTMAGKEAAEHLQGVWMIELAELNATKKADRDAQKAFITRQFDIYRVAYAKNTTRFPRQCIFWGSTNEYNFLRDPTGDRRTLPIVCFSQEPIKSIFDDLDDEVDQLWAEAVVMYRNGEKLRLVGEAKEIAEQKQREHREDTPLSGLIEEYLNKEYPLTWDSLDMVERMNYLRGDTGDFDILGAGSVRKDRVCVMEVWCELLGKRPGDLKPINSKEIGDVLRCMEGWKPSKSVITFGPLYGKQRGFIRDITK